MCSLSVVYRISLMIKRNETIKLEMKENVYAKKLSKACLGKYGQKSFSFFYIKCEPTIKPFPYL